MSGPSVHVSASCVAIHGAGILLLGKSGSGKSDLALRLIHEGATLVGDDQLLISTESGRMIASAPPNITGLLEIRGLGIVRLPSVGCTVIELAVELVEPGKVERLPEMSYYEQLGVRVPQICLYPFEPSCTAKIEQALHAFHHHCLVERLGSH